jgi:hypothetical protein
MPYTSENSENHYLGSKNLMWVMLAMPDTGNKIIDQDEMAIKLHGTV